MVKIRLSRFGKKNQPTYRIVVVEARKKRDGKYIEAIGFYNPNSDPSIVKLEKKRYLYWLERGAQPTKTVSELARRLNQKAK